MRTSKAVVALWPTLWALAGGCTPAESFRGIPGPDAIPSQGTGGGIGVGTGGDGSGGLTGSGGEGAGGTIDPGGTGGAGTGGTGTGGAIDAPVDQRGTGGSGGNRDASPESAPADARDVPAETPTLLTFEDHCLPAYWTATASVQAGVAITAIDGDPATAWQSNAPQAGTEFFQVDLGDTITLNRVVLDNMTGANQTDYPRGYRIMVSTDGTNFPTMAAVALAGPPGEITFINFPAVSARALRIYQTGTDSTFWWSIHELRLGCQPLPVPPGGAFDPLDPGGWKVSASASMAGSPPALAVDGNFDTRWTTGASQKGNEWFLIDLGASTMLSELWLTSRISPGYFPAQYNVEVSADNQTFTSAATGTGAIVTKIKFTPRAARYVRIRQTGTTMGSFWAIDQLAIRP